MSVKTSRNPVSAPTAILVAGPARSGKSEWAERLAYESGRPVVYVATAREDPHDADWSARIEAHRLRRPAQWSTLCAPTELETALIEHGGADRCLLVDSLGTWVANLIELDDRSWRERAGRLLEVVDACPALLILVAEETGWGVIPAYPVGRTFRDRLGDLIRRLGPRCGSSYLVTGGYALDLAQIGVPVV
ncbi:bifunctional adenosylcobinamide kinase/adenosylcobinamide-phosphate guanylyltransferase [Thiobaca trueperi]|uniref:Bifunctional adenosylcobalamin biosynthesis protein n=1 Tax=Thiobaca trueperi TaxID=127458 RepID=A0A4R3MW85_9GAMM|nr:bifunctional adenosylcobinamide kinase/adenosylcobinamide-phosphate guanylyltransferase [Thiobaca trueperi]TCT19711.1 adenosylcobinamide kinase /adenosylcobinamide-phosphate guanylyltransferase [Thiobaca trueperi]